MKVIRLIPFLLILSVLFGCPRDPVGPGPVVPGVPVNLTVKVLDAFSGAPIPNARVSIQQDGKSIGLRDVPSDGSGTALFSQVPSGIGYKVFANSVQGYTPGASPSLKLATDMEITIAMQQSVNGAGLIAGSVKSSDKQQPLAGVTISMAAGGGGPPVAALGRQSVARSTYGPYAQRAPGPYRIQQIGIPGGGGDIRQSDDAGQFTFENVPAGTYELTYQFGDFSPQTRTVTVNPGDIATVETVFLGAGTSTGGGISQGHILVAEPARVYQIDASGKAIWNYSGRQISGASRLTEGATLVADEGNNDVFIVSHLGQVVWSVGSSLGLFKRLNLPGWVTAAQDGKSFLVADTGNNRIVEFQGGQTTWSKSFEYELGLNRPRSATYAKNGNIIVADTGNKRVAEVDRNGQIVWSAFKDLGAPVHALRLDDGNTLITDTLYNRVIMVNTAGQAVWFYDGVNGAAPDPAGGLNRPRSAYRDPGSGNIFIVDTGNNRIIEVSTSSRSIVNTVSPVNAPVAFSRL